VLCSFVNLWAQLIHGKVAVLIITNSLDIASSVPFERQNLSSSNRIGILHAIFFRVFRHGLNGHLRMPWRLTGSSTLLISQRQIENAYDYFAFTLRVIHERV